MKQRPLLVLSAVRRSERRRPPAMSRRPAMVPCCAKVGCKHGRVRRSLFQLSCHTAWQGMCCVWSAAEGCGEQGSTLPLKAVGRLMPISSSAAASHLQNGLVWVPEVDLAIQCGGGQLLAIGAPSQRQHVVLQERAGGPRRQRAVAQALEGRGLASTALPSPAHHGHALVSALSRSLAA